MDAEKAGNRPLLSVVIPVYQEAGNLLASLEHFQTLRHNGAELIVVDGYSRDDSHQLLQTHSELWDVCVLAGPGRARQMNAGAHCARADKLLFLHLDSRFRSDFPVHQLSALTDENNWAYFQLALCRKDFPYNVIGRSINWRSKVSGSVTGDQGICLSKSLFERMGGYPDIPLMEDIALSDALRKHKAPLPFNYELETSSRRWQKHGVFKTVLLMWWLRAQYRLGVSPYKLAKKYYPHFSFSKVQDKPSQPLEKYLKDTGA
nr:TIGR04283 family arsenosugar biosynthesis glycosyltransferase [Pseudoteredinibacter isoporae]